MRHRVLRLLATCAFLLLAAVPVPLAAHDEFRFVGAVVKTEASVKAIFVKFKEADGKDETVRIALTDKTEITRDKAAAPKSALKVGINVVVDALGDDYDNLDALSIRIVPPPATK